MSSVFRVDALIDHVALVSGGTSGINLAIATEYARRGAKVAVFGRDSVRAAAARDTILTETGADPRHVLGLSCDVRDAEAVDRLVKNVAETLGKLTIVVAGAAGNFPAPAIDISAKGFRTVVEIDLLGTYHVFRSAFDVCAVSGASFIAISAEQASNAHSFQSHVCSAKAAVNMLVKTLALEWGPAQVRVNAIVPGPIDGTEGMARLAPTQAARAAIEGRIPLRRYGRTNEVADLAIFLASNAAQYITASIFNCDGGSTTAGLGDPSIDCLVSMKSSAA